MIVRREGASFRLVTQPDHAAFAADLLALCRLPDLVDHPRRADLLRAVRLHDNGWRELDAAPRLDPANGEPYSFLGLPAALRLELWARGTARYVATDPYVALLTTLHALALFGGEASAGWPELLADLGERRESLLERCGLRAEAADGDYRFLGLADRLSLVVCNGWREPFEAPPLRGALTAGGLELDPFPLAGSTTFAVACRRIPVRHYSGDADLAVTLAAARWESMPARLVPRPAQPPPPPP